MAEFSEQPTVFGEFDDFLYSHPKVYCRIIHLAKKQVINRHLKSPLRDKRSHV